MTLQTPPPPPRMTGNVSTDIVAIANWLNDFFTVVVRGGFFVETGSQFDTDSFDASSLPDPASSTIAKAQQTANEAFVLASQNRTVIESDLVTGEAEVADTNDSFVVTFAEEQSDDKYSVSVTPVSVNGTPDPASAVIETIDRTATDLTVTLQAAPGSGNSRTFHFILLR